MMNLIVDFGINILMALLLGATIFYCWLLNKRIQVLQDSKGELAKLLNRFDHSTLKAAETIHTLQLASKKIVETIQARIEKANYTMDDLNYMIDRASKAADQMEAGIAIARQKDKLAKHALEQPAAMPSLPETKSEIQLPVKAVAPTSQTPETLSQAINLAEMILGEPLAANKVKSGKGKAKQPANTLSSLQALIEKVAERRSDPVLRANQKTVRGSSKARSQSEEELLEVLRVNSKV